MPKYVRDWCKHYRYGDVPRDHQCDAKLVLVGEAPGKTEIKKGRPFVGESGHLLETELWSKVGLTRDDFYITNVLPYKPWKTNPLDSEPKENISRGVMALRSRLHSRTSPNVIIPLGNLALYALTGQRGIMKWRGSIVNTPWGKTVPTIHPAAILRSWSLLKTSLTDWSKIASQAATPLVRLPNRRLIPTVGTDRRVWELLNAEKLAVDIECDRETHTILCISFAASRDLAYSIDCRKGIPDIVKRLLASPAVKIFQKGFFDVYILRKKYGFTVSNYTHDTALLYHAIDNNVGPQTQEKADSGGGKSVIKPYSLAYMASVWTNEPYWKDSAKDEGTGERYGAWRNRWKQFQIYNARDSAVTFELGERLEQHLRSIGRWEWYLDQYASLIEPLLELSMHGVQFDSQGAASEYGRLQGEVEAKRKYFAGIEPKLIVRHVFKKEPKTTGERKDGIVLLDTTGEYGFKDQWIKIGKSVSTQEMQKYLKKLRLRTRNLDEIALRQLQLKVADMQPTWRRSLPLSWEQTTTLLSEALNFRKLESKSKFLQAKSVDSDGRIRSEYSLLTQTGRLSSSKNPLGTGMNLQNQKRDIRHFYIPDQPDWYLLSHDYSQAEDLVVKALSKDERAIELIKAVQQHTIDIHKRLAQLVFAGQEIDYGKRYVSKRGRHADNYGMQAARFQEVLLKDGFVYTLEECERILQTINDADPWVPEWQRSIRRIITQNRNLVTSWGWQLSFANERLRDSGVFRRGYAFIPQSEVGVAMKQLGLRFMYHWLRDNGMKSKINMLVHDELVISCPREELFPVTVALRKSLETPRLYKNRWKLGDDTDAVEMYIPAETTVSKTLKCICGNCVKPLEFKDLPSQDEFYKKLSEWENEHGYKMAA